MMQSLLGQPSAVSQMLSLLANQPPAGQPGQPAPMPAAPMPNVSMTPPDPSQINAGMSMPEQPQSLLGKIHDYISDRLGIKGPTGYGGLLTPEEEQQAKPGIWAALGGATANANANHILEMHQIATAIGEHRRIMQSRADMPNNLGLPDQLKYAVQHGDIEMIKTLGDPLSRMLSTDAAPPKAEAPHTLPTAAGIMQWDPDQKKYVPTGMQAPDKAPRNIDPLSAEGIAAQLRVNAGKAAQKGGLGNLPAPMAAKVGQAGEMIKKASDLLPQMDNIDMNVGNSAAQDIAAKGIGAFGMHIPGSQGVGSMLLNHSEPYAKYQASLSPFILAAAHALSGARINADQVEQIRQSIEFKPGDSPAVRAQKRKNMIDLTNSIGGSLPQDAIASQEDQMDPAALATLKGYGYKGAARGGNAPAQTAGKPRLTQAQYNAGRAKGHSAAEIASHYDLTGITAK